MDDPDKLLTVDEVAAWLGVPRSWVYRQSKTGNLPTVRVGRYVRWRRGAIEDWIRRQETQPKDWYS